MSSIEVPEPTSFVRRRLPLAGAAVTTAPLRDCGGGESAKVAPVVNMTLGKFIGQPDCTTLSYLGIPYAQPRLDSCAPGRRGLTYPQRRTREGQFILALHE
jgi:hypothetical protein